MEKNIFEGAKFGDKFVTRDGRVAIYWRNEQKNGCHVLIIGDDNVALYVEDNGLLVGNHDIISKFPYDIVSKYVEPIDEDKLDELAKNFSEYHEYANGMYNYKDILICQEQSFKAGYKKAKEE